jgi:hypothetical protein
MELVWHTGRTELVHTGRTELVWHAGRTELVGHADMTELGHTGRTELVGHTGRTELGHTGRTELGHTGRAELVGPHLSPYEPLLFSFNTSLDGVEEVTLLIVTVVTELFGSQSSFRD